VSTGPAAALPHVHATSAALLADAARRAPHAPALAFGQRRLDYADYLACVAGFAGELAALGVRGGRVATVLANSLEACVAAFAVQAAGAQLVPLNPLYTARELDALLRDAQPALLLVDDSLADALAAPARAAGVGRVLALGPASRLLDAWRGRPAALPDPAPEPGDPALLQYTGGTTGRAKGVNLSHRAVMTNVAQRQALLPVEGENERVLCVMPLFHSYAMAMGLFLAAYSRACLVVLPRYHPDEVLAAIERERITIFPGSPTIFTGLMAHPAFARTDWHRVHTCYSGASALPQETLRRWREAVGAPVYEGYGQTEAGPVLSFNPAGGPVKAGSVGVAAPGTEIEIVDVESGTRVLAAGERGEIRARGPQIMQGYRDRPEETAQALRDGWLYTGDIGELDDDGYLYIRDRKKDMVIVGGYNVYPREVEEVLMLHPDVLEAAVIGRPDARRGESVHAFVALREGAGVDAEALVEHCRANLVRYKIPERIELVAALPKTGVNKIDKAALRAGGFPHAPGPAVSPESP